jgi:D-alanine-D-alanine ligase-like ATP-grasp enzyme
MHSKHKPLLYTGRRSSRGMARVDMIWTEPGAASVIEVNGVPGFSEVSIIPQQAEKSGFTKRL